MYTVRLSSSCSKAPRRGLSLVPESGSTGTRALGGPAPFRARQALERAAPEAIHRPQLWKQLQIRPDHHERRHPAQYDGRHQPEPAGGEAGLKLTELVGGADKHRAHGAHAPTDGIRRLELDENVTDIDAHHVADSQEHERCQR